MKNFLLAIVMGFAPFVVLAQDPCATKMPTEMVNWLKTYKLSHPFSPVEKTSSNDTITWLPLKVHSVGTDAGAGYYRVNQVLDMLCQLNKGYLSIGWQFYLYGDIDYIPSTILDQHTGNYQQIIDSKSIVNVPNIFFVTNPSGACGYFYGYGGPSDNQGYQGFVAINKSCAGTDNTTVTHEVGHYFSLLHPFNGWEGRQPTDPAQAGDEYVDESNCQVAGDYMCDTRADYLNYRWGCPYTGTKTDYKGDHYNPDGTLYMGYSIEPCATRFSAEQVDAMKSYLPSTRNYLNIPHDSFPDIVDTAKLIYPPNGAGGVSPSYVQLVWHSVPGATLYSVQSTLSASAAVLNLDTIVSDTSLLLSNYSAGYTYRWRVRAFNPGKTCSPYTYYNTFKTNGLNGVTPTFNNTPVTCAGDSDGTIFLSVPGSVGTYTYKWNTGDNNTYLSNLKGGIYTVTVADATHDSVVYSTIVSQPQPLSVQFGYAGNNIFANVTGGSGTYNYHWSNGATSQNPGNISAGSYSVTVTDSKGCSATQTFAYNAIDEVTGLHELNIYPNPIYADRAITIEVQSGTTYSTTIEIFDQLGRSTLLYNKEIMQGNNRFSLDISNLSSGIYIVRVNGKTAAINKKIVLY